MATDPTRKLAALRRVLLVALPAVLLMLGGLVFVLMAGMRAPAPRTEDSQEITEVDVVELRPQTARLDLFGYGTVRPHRETRVTAEVSGRVVYVSPMFKRGNFVGGNGTMTAGKTSTKPRKGKAADALIRLDPEPLEIERDRARAKLDEAQAALRHLKHGGEPLRNTVDVLRRQLELSQREYGRLEKLRKNETATQIETDRVEATLLEAKQRLIDAEERAAKLPDQIKQAEAVVQQAQAAVRSAERDLKRTVIKAPYHAQVISSQVKAGQFVQRGQELGRLASAKTYEVPVMVSPRKLANVAFVPANVLPEELRLAEWLGTPKASVTWLAYGDRYTWAGRMTRVEPMDEKTRTFALVIEVDNPWRSLIEAAQPPLMTGAYCSVRIEGDRVDNSMILPESAVHEGNAVYLMRDGKLGIVHVEVIHRRDNDVVVVPESTKPDFAILMGNMAPIPPRLVAQASECVKRALAESPGVAGIRHSQIAEMLCFAIELTPDDASRNQQLEALARAAKKMKAPGRLQVYLAQPAGYYPSFGFGEQVVVSPLPYPVPGMPLSVRHGGDSQ